MDKEQLRNLNRMIRARRLRVFGPAVIVALGMLVLFGAFFIPWEDGEKFRGTVVSLERFATTRSTSKGWYVRLDRGETITVGGISHLQFEKGRRVMVQQRLNPVFGIQGFRFVRYLDKPAR